MDAERAQDFDEAVRTHDAAGAAYRRYGYERVPLPQYDVASRVAFVRRHVERGA
jgi:predicted ATPase